jgi:hypothetical protein
MVYAGSAYAADPYAGTAPRAYASAVLADAPALFFQLDESSGLFQDSSGNARHATSVDANVVRSLAPVTNDGGTAVSASGTSEIARWSGTTITALNAGSVSIEFWLRTPSSLATSHGTFVKIGTTGGWDVGLGAGREDQAGSRLVIGLNGITWLDTGVTLSASSTYHVIVTRSSGNIFTLYLNGAPVYTSATQTVTTTTASQILLGDDTGGTTERLTTGLVLDNVAVYPSVLSQARASAHWVAGRAQSTLATTTYMSAVLADTPAAYYPLYETADNYVDVSGNGRTAVATSGATRGKTSLLSEGGAAVAGSGTANIASHGGAHGITMNNATVECFVKIPATSNLSGGFAGFANGGWAVGFGTTRTTGGAFAGRNLVIGQHGVNWRDTGYTFPTAGGTFHVVVTWDSTNTVRSYVNGTLVATNTGWGAPSASTAGIRVGEDEGSYLASTVDVQHAAFYSQVLSGTQVATHYNASQSAVPVVVPYSAAVLADSPWRYFPLDESSGTVVTDSVTGATATLSAAADGYRQAGPQPTGPAMLFNNGQYVEGPIDSGITGGDFTAEFWMKPTNLTAGTPKDFFGFGGETRFARSSDVSQPLGDVEVALGSATIARSAAGVIQNNVAQHMVFRYTAATGVVDVFRNGVVIMSVTQAVNGFTPTGNWRFLSAQFSGRGLAGLMSNLAFYKAALSTTRITAHYNAGLAAAVSGTIAAPVSSPTAALAGTTTPPAITGTFAGAVSSPTAAVSGTALPPAAVSGTLAGAVSSPTGTLAGTRTVPTFSGVLAGTVASPTARTTGTVTAPNVAPTANFTWTLGSVPGEVVFDGLSSSDPDGSIVNFAWDFGNGQTVSGAPSDWSGATVEYGPTVGSYQVQLTVTDNRGGTGTVTKTVSVGPAPVTASLQGAVSSPTATVIGALAAPMTGAIAGILLSPAASLAGIVTRPADRDPDVLSGTGGTFTIGFDATSSHTVTFTPSFAGSMVMQAADNWQASYTITDSDGDDVQDDVGTLGVIWVGDEQMSITIAPVAGQPPIRVTFTWSYAARASSPLSISLDNDEVLETPGGLGIDIYNGQPSDSVTLSILGPTAVADFQTTTLDTFGVREDLMVRLPALDAGDYFLRVEGDVSGSEDTPFTVLDDALSQADETRVDDIAPLRDPALHWRLFDLRDHAVNYTFVRNPSSWTNVYPPNDFTHDKTTAVDGQPLTWQAAARPWRMEFTGWLDTETEYNDLLFWSQLRRRLWLVDHRNRAWLITIEQFDAQAQVKPNLPWAHKYTVKTLVFMQG